MKILVDCHAFDNEKYQGITSYIKGLYLEMIKNSPNIEFYLACHSIENIYSIFSKFENVTFLKLKSKNPVYRLIYEFPKLIITNQIDWLHCQNKSPFLKFCKEIVTTHDILFLDYPQFFGIKFRLLNLIFYRKSAKRADILLTVSKYSKEQIHNHFKIPLKDINITPCGISSSLIELSKNDHQLPDINKKYNLDEFVLYVSRIEPRKNHETLVKALDTNSLSHLKVVFVGTETHENLILKNELNLCNVDVIHLKNVTLNELASLYRSAKLTIFPSYCEGFGIPPLESLIFKTNCVCSNTTAMKDYKEFMVDTFNPNDFIDLRNKILKHLYRSFELNTEEIIQYYSWSKSAQVLTNKLKK
jgi:glycosyltransferase involved in cell wall biosynthesis